MLILLFLGLRPLWLPDDGRYAEVAREMVSSGDWITPQLNNIPHYSKPPITYWVAALGILAFGKNEFAVRLAVALPFIGTILLTYLIACGFRDRRTGYIAGLIVMTSPIPFIAANIITPDMMLTCFELGAIYFIWKWHRNNRRSIRPLLVAYVFFGLSFMTKGPVGLFVPFLAFFGYAVFTGEWRILKAFGSFRGWMVFLLIGLPWYVILVIRHPGLLDYFLGRELADRMFTTVHHRDNTFLIYPAALLGGMLPWTIYFVKSLKHAFPFKALRERKLTPHHALMLSWILFPLVFFSLVRSRLPLYVLLLFVPMAILAAEYLRDFADRTGADTVRKATRIAAVMSVVLAGLQIGAAIYPSSQNLFPLVERMREASLDDPRVYSNRNDLYVINFYTGTAVTVTNDYDRFLLSDEPSFYILDRQGTESDLPPELQHLPILAHHANYWLFSNWPVDFEGVSESLQ